MAVPNLPPGYALNYIPVLSPIEVDAMEAKQTLEALSTTPPMTVIKMADVLSTLSSMIDEAFEAKNKAGMQDLMNAQK